jgi:hypothetical protein
MAAAEPMTGGQSMPSTVTAGRAQTMSETVPSPSRDTPGSRQASVRNCSGGQGTPSQVWVLSSPVTVVLPASSRRVASRWMRAARASGAGPPYMPEWTSDDSDSTLTTTLARPRRLTVTAGTPTAALPVSQTRMASARSWSACLGT